MPHDVTPGALAAQPATEALPFHKPSIGEQEIAAVVETLRTGWITTGPRVTEFEQRFAEFVGAEHAIAVNSATAALHLALEAVGVERDDEVIIPTMTFAATGEVVVYLNARPVLVDCDAATLNMDPEAVERAVTPRTKAIVPVHFGGEPCNMDQLCAIAARHKLRVIEDAAHALPASFNGRTIGTIGDITCFSFYATKTITTGEGGMITTAAEDLASRMRRMSLHGLSRDAWKRYTAEGSWRYEILDAGYKYNLTDIAAALGIVQLRRCNEFWQARAAIAEQYQQGFEDLAELVRPAELPDRLHAWHLYVIQLVTERLRIGRDEFLERLRDAGIGASVHFIPLHLHPFYQRLGWRPEQFPVATSAFTRILSLPIFPGMTQQDVARVIEAVRTIVTECRR